MMLALSAVFDWEALSLRAFGSEPELASDKASAEMRVFGIDDRTRILDTMEAPWPSIGQVQARWQNGETRTVRDSTGVLIGQRTVLTCGHCIYDLVDGWADTVRFVPGLNGSEQPFGSAGTSHLIAPQQWVADGNNSFDVALIVLDEALGSATGTMMISVEPPEFFSERGLNTAGYPATIGNGTWLYHTFGEAVDVEGQLLRHYLDSTAGQSGSPIWDYDSTSDQRRVVAVLTGSREVTSGEQLLDTYNVAIYLNQTIVNWINTQVTAYDSGQVTQHSSTQETVTPNVNEGDVPVAGLCGAGFLQLAMAALPGWLILTSGRFAGGSRRRSRCPT